jgi:hypothetical protein
MPVPETILLRPLLRVIDRVKEHGLDRRLVARLAGFDDAPSLDPDARVPVSRGGGALAGHQ